jgi:hypothetical protein
MIDIGTTTLQLARLLHSRELTEDAPGQAGVGMVAA